MAVAVGNTCLVAGIPVADSPVVDIPLVAAGDRKSPDGRRVEADKGYWGCWESSNLVVAGGFGKGKGWGGTGRVGVGGREEGRLVVLGGRDLRLGGLAVGRRGVGRRLPVIFCE